jgi:hypothetical protein
MFVVIIHFQFCVWYSLKVGEITLSSLHVCLDETHLLSIFKKHSAPLTYIRRLAPLEPFELTFLLFNYASLATSFGNKNVFLLPSFSSVRPWNSLPMFCFYSEILLIQPRSLHDSSYMSRVYPYIMVVVICCDSVITLHYGVLFLSFFSCV